MNFGSQQRSALRPSTFPRVSIVTLDTGGNKNGNDGGNDGGNDEQAVPDDSALVEALRFRAAESLERAYRFLETQPDSWALLRAQVLCEARPAADLAAKIAEIQAEDGRVPTGTLISGGGLGFPPLQLATIDEEAKGLIGTVEALLMAGDAKVLHADWVERAIRFVESKQSDDGAYRVLPIREVGRATATDVEQESDVFWTGMTAGILGRTPLSKTAHLEAAGAFLAEHFSPEVVEHDGYSSLLAFSHYYTNVPDEEADEALQWCGRALEKGFRSRSLDAVSTLRVLLTCDAQAMPGATFDVTELLERLLEEQARDGGFAELALGGPATRTTQTFDAMLAIVRLCAAIDLSD